MNLFWRESDGTVPLPQPVPGRGASWRTPRPGPRPAAFGGYLRELGLVKPPATVTVHQGVDMGRPSLLTIDIDAEAPEIRVTGRAVAM